MKGKEKELLLNPHAGFLRLKDVLKIIPVARSTWLRGVESGRYPRSIKLSERTVAWAASEIYELVKNLQTKNSYPFTKGNE
ncbi:helix-turn-helix transcriptional regulator [Maridesulfovibrio hydrothermalis]|uniref:AlpA family phage regulatory protein n=1 Tax=Maridesulfovibrio hydrothermalis AM13 = DSM 14728 TaxID=1121451 RepID=L0R716_9BACT|nr:AlpA family phage regulatory protein [Maridesulfovibrio hydrothermalis]CCO22007.1 protein of unknown function [Maridesulfovibrio hydrothermalis AM13 = DSM 14728]